MAPPFKIPGYVDGVNPLDRNSWRTSVRRCQVLPTYPGVRDNRSTINTKTGYDDDDDVPAPKPQL